MKITFVTGNLGKVEEVSRFLKDELDHVSLDLHEIQSLDLEEIVRHKAEEAYKKLKKPLLVEDVSLVFKSLGKLPGPFVKWFERELGYDELAKLVQNKNRDCVAEVCYGFHDGKKIHLTKAKMEGSVAESPRGKNSFGWASIFVPKGMKKTYAELTKEEQNKISYRRKALEKLSSKIII